MISDETKPQPQKEHYRAPHGAVWPVRYEVIHTRSGSRIPCGEDEEEALVARDLTCVTCPTCKAEAERGSAFGPDALLHGCRCCGGIPDRKCAVCNLVVTARCACGCLE